MKLLLYIFFFKTLNTIFRLWPNSYKNTSLMLLGVSKIIFRVTESARKCPIVRAIVTNQRHPALIQTSCWTSKYRIWWMLHINGKDKTVGRDPGTQKKLDRQTCFKLACESGDRTPLEYKRKDNCFFSPFRE